jgi:hypothetical protein
MEVRIMRKVVWLSLVLALAFVTSAAAKSAEVTGALEKFRYLELSGAEKDAHRAGASGVFSTAVAGTTFYGGTLWAADSNRWEAKQNSLWTFDTGVGSSRVPVGGSTYPGVDPNKLPGLHQTLEGWVGFDNTYSELTYFRRLASTDARWTAPGGQGVCVGSAGGLAGTFSYWAGVFAGEANTLCYAAGQGYGNAWNVCIGKTFNWTGGSVSLSFLYRNDTEPGFDFTNVVCDTSGGAGDDVLVTSFDGPSGGTASVTLSAGQELPTTGPKPIVLKFCATSDVAYSDQDGLYATSCGAFGVDNITASGGITESATFETGNNGWALLPAAAGPGGEWSNLVSLSDLPAPLTPCICALDDTVLVFEDLSVNGHGLFQDNLAASPWVDLGPGGFNNQAPGKLIKVNVYAEMPLLNYVFAQFNVQWYPEVCLNTGKLITSAWTSDGFVYYFGGVPNCTTTAPPVLGAQFDFSGIVPTGASQVRIGVGVLSYCRFFANCTGVSNSTPWFDYIGLGVYGNPNAPYIAVSEIDAPQDAFPENGTLSATAPGRIDCNNVKGQASPEVESSLGDTLIVLGAVGNAEVWVDFAVDPGPGINLTAFNAWRNSHAVRGTHDGQTWYTARLDTAEQGDSGPVSGTWMTAYHESDPNFSGTDRSTDPTDLDPLGQSSRLANDIFPDNLFTPGTRVNLFYRTKYVASPDLPANWFTTPDTAGGFFTEWECLPSSTAPDGSGGYRWNCVLYVDHFDGRGAQNFVETGLASLLGGSSGNFEGTRWDRYDVEAPSSQQASLGRPLRTEYGANIIQVFAYTDILWNSGDLNAFNLVKEDGDVLLPWLTLVDFGDNDLYLSGDGIVTSPILEGASEPSARALLQDVAGLNLRCQTYRSANCPSGSPADNSACVDLDPVAGAPVAVEAARGAIHVAQGNGCPQLRSFDVISLGTPDRGVVRGDEQYAGTKTVTYASSATDAGGADGLNYRVVVDGQTLHYRRDDGTPCDFNLGGANAVTERLEEVLSYLGISGSACSDPTAGTGIPIGDRPSQFRTTLANFAPNPLLAGATGRIQFTVAREGKARIDILDVEGRLVRTVFDGVAREGVNDAFWNGTNASGNQVANGVYFYRLRAGDEDLSKKMVVVRNGGN